MKSCKSSQVRLFRLHFSRRWDQNPCVSHWIYRAVMLNVCEIDICANIIKLPMSLFNSKTLTTLRLDSTARDWSISNSAWRFPCQVHLPCLITLDVVVTFTPFDYVYKLIRGCPALENLSLEVSSRNEEHEYVFNIPTLKRLKLDWSGLDKYCIDVVVLDVPNLEYLYICRKLCSTFVMEDMSSLVEASVSFSTLTKLSLFNCNTLTKLSVHQHYEYKISWEFPCQFTLPCLSTLDIDLAVTPFANVVELIHSCPMLENLSLELSSDNREKYYVFDIPTLKRLKLNWKFGGYPNLVGTWFRRP
ncbi:hypothetical protein QVD17_33164 [Tagetes erecta]|uniref:F-box/LRR-repeat protein 15/At3g58940/PEG3-like LRR domain-containing protein n=1 Tax=Tagetes erecta TaxID=13708 RepID=A0AAD8K0P2_TARER|nr:hypothetical protein QVD17_33164 [Tagetes erecta]